MNQLVLIALGLFVGSGIAAADAVRDAYDLQERCGKRATEVFQASFPTANGGAAIWSADKTQFSTSFRNHYNTKLNRCFMLQTTIAMTGDVSTQIVLFDANENKDYGTYFKFLKSPTPMECSVNGRFCSSEAEWNALARPYMED